MRPDDLTARNVERFLANAVDVGPDAGPAPAEPVAALSRAWERAGLRAGDLVMLALPNGVALLRHVFALLRVGAVPVLAPPGLARLRLEELALLLGVRAAAAARFPAGLSAIERRGAVGGAQVILWRPAMDPGVRPGEVVILTSGTSGVASGCAFPLDALLRNAARHADAIGQREGDTVLVNLPLRFSFGLVAQALATFLRRGRLVIAGPPFHAPSYRAALSGHGVSISSLTPLLARALLATRMDWPPTLRVLTVGGDALAPDDARALLRQRPGAELYLTYGLTEAGPRVSTLAAHAEPDHRLASVGRPLPGVRVTLRATDDDAGRRELVVEADTVARRRIGRIEGRAELANGRVCTGDLFNIDGDGYLFFLQRLSDVLVRGGEKVCLASVRRLALALPGVVRASTRLVAASDGSPDYELTLEVAEDAAHDANIYAGALRQRLCRAERPGRINLVSATEVVRAYK